MRRLLCVIALLVSGCPRNPVPRMALLEEDPSIIFPEFYEQRAQRVGAPGSIHELDGATLQAIRVAADDFLPTDSREGPCWERRAAHRYRVIRRADVIFVRIDVDPAACDRKVLPLDSGVEYAIRVDGRILRRIFDGEPQTGPLEDASDAGTPTKEKEPVTYPVGATWGDPSPAIPPGWLDGGTRQPAPSSDGGTPAMPAEQER